MEIKDITNLNYLWSYLVIEELYRNGVKNIFISPGSRSTPLTYSSASHPGLKKIVHFDERGLAFHALGYVSATKSPAAIISTSGSAVANFFPAIIEFSKKKLPLLILTADRPPELRKTGAHQTIDQPGIFGKYVRWAIDMPPPDKNIDPEFVLTTIDQAVSISLGELPGPVHINFMFREPLAPVKKDKDVLPDIDKRWLRSDHPFTKYSLPEKKIPPGVLKDTANIINGSRNGVIVAGKLENNESANAAIALSDKTGWPLFGDVVSGTRNKKGKYNINNWDLLLLERDIFKKSIDTVLHLGGRITSKRWYKLIEEVRPSEYITVINHPLRNDPLNVVSRRIIAPPGEFASDILDFIKSRLISPLTEIVLRLSKITEEYVTGALKKSEKLNEAFIARALSESVPDTSAIFLGNSMPVRDMDMFYSGRTANLVWGGNRGASGIDGNIATATGFFKGIGILTTLLIGDLAVLHDLNSLKLASDTGPGFNIVIINNNGGGIFSFLPISEFRGYFNRYFTTPQDIELSGVAEMFGINYLKVENIGDIEDIFKEMNSNGRVNLVEIIVDRNDNVVFHKNLYEKLKSMYKKESGA